MMHCICCREKTTPTHTYLCCIVPAEHSVKIPDAAYYSGDSWQEVLRLRNSVCIKTTGGHIHVLLLLNTSLHLYCLAHFTRSLGHYGTHKTLFCQFFFFLKDARSPWAETDYMLHKRIQDDSLLLKHKAHITLIVTLNLRLQLKMFRLPMDPLSRLEFWQKELLMRYWIRECGGRLFWLASRS